MKTIDLRSDTFTKPSIEMRRAIFNAEVGDDVFGEDPSVNQLEQMCAELLKKEAALFVSSGTQGNLISVLCHCNRGEEYIAGHLSHVYRWEAGGCAVLGGVNPQPIPIENDGTLDLKIIEEHIKPYDVHFAKTKLLALENTMWGKVLPLDYLKEFSAFAKKHQLQTHLDGARIFNASVALRVPVSDISKHFDSISMCLSKGLGTPVGSVICSTKAFIEKARHLRKMLGGGMRQAGILAAAGIYALQNNVERLAEDHKNASYLATELRQIPVLQDNVEAHTNIIQLHLTPEKETALINFLKSRGVFALGRKGTVRFVTHLDVDRRDMEMAVQVIREFFA